MSQIRSGSIVLFVSYRFLGSGCDICVAYRQGLQTRTFFKADEGAIAMVKPLTETNSYLRDPEARRKAFEQHVIASAAIEGIHVRPFGSFVCCACNKLLAKSNKLGAVAGEIKCPRCGHINEV